VTLRFPVAPMKATMGSLPEGVGWAYEIKWDGYRTIAHVGDRPDRALRLQSTGGKDVTERWPELHALAGAVHATSAILDGELVVLDDDGWPNFELVQQSGAGAARQATLHLFDVLRIDDTDTVDLPYEARRHLLEQLVDPGPNWAVPTHRVGDGDALLAATATQGLEGVIAKRLGSTYRPGTRTKDWVKVKNRIRVELPIGGFTAGTGRRSATFGALLVGRHIADDSGRRLAFAGGVGTGFDERTLADLATALRSIETVDCPFDPPPPAGVARTATWVEPALTAQVEIAEFTNDGLVRHASFVRLVTE